MKLKDAIYKSLPYSLQNLAISSYGNKIKKERFCKEYSQWQDFFDKSQYFSMTEQEEYQNKHLKQIISHACETVPYYRRIFNEKGLNIKDVNSTEDLYKIPILTKEKIKNNFKDLISSDYKETQLKNGHTSGTTGSPLEILWDKNVDILHNAAIWRHRKWAGFEFGERYATLLGRVIVPIERKKRPYYRINKPWNQFLFSSFHLSDENLHHYFEDFAKNNIRFMEAYPSTAYILARYLQQHDLYYEMKVIVTSSETLLPIQRELIEERFKCKIFDYYGMSERVMFSGECEHHNGHHLYIEYGITEILDEKNEPVAPGGFGKLVLTGLNNYGMPLIRYEIGDASGIKNEECSCGRKLPLLEAVTTKAEDIVVTPDGRLISSSVLTHPFKPMDNIEKSQIIQEDYNNLLIKIVRKASYSDNDTKQLIGSMQQRVGQEMKISVEFVADIPRNKSGKYRWVISRVPIKYGSKDVGNLYEN